MSKASALVDVGKKRVNPLRELWQNKFLYLLALPAIAYTFIFSYLTLPYIVIAFEKFNYKTGIMSPFVGLKNFEYFFKSSWAWTVTRNTLVINILFLLVGTVCAVLLAIVLNEVKAKKFLKASQSMMLFPYFISWVIVSYMLQGILGTDTGLINNMIVAGGGSRINFYSTPSYWYPILLLLNIWKNTGYNTIVYLAAITGIDEGLYEAAYIDGATRFKRIIYITIPLLTPTICIMTLMSVGRIFYGDFGMLYAIIRDNSSLMPIAEVIDTYVQNLNAISATAEDPESGLKFLNWLYASEENHNLYHYGIEGTHYTMTGDHRMEQVKGEDGNAIYDMTTWMTGYLPYMNYAYNSTDDYIDYSTYKSENYVISPAAGFIFDATNVQSELTNLQTEIIASIYPIKVGMVPYEENIDAAIEKLKAAGLDTYLEEYRTQFAAYLEANPSALENAKGTTEG